MITGNLKITAALATALALAGCFGGSGGGGGSGGVPVTIDETVLSASAGTLAEPYILPATFPSGTNGGIDDYRSRGGVWQVSFNGMTAIRVSGPVTATLGSTAIYDTANDEWTITVDGADITMPVDGGIPTGGRYVTPSTCSVNCGELSVLDSGISENDYGFLARAWYRPTGLFADSVYFFAHFGMKTPLGDIPNSGTASFSYGSNSGFFVRAYYDRGDGVMRPLNFIGDPALTATFSPSGGAVDLNLDTGVQSNGSWLTLAGSATITGNEYSGTVTGEFYSGDEDAVTVQLAPDGAGSSYSGAFYGPSMAETLGVVYAATEAGSATTGELVGQFQAKQTSYTP